MLKLEIDPRTNKLGYAHTSCNTTRSSQTTIYSADGKLHFRFGTSSILYSTTALPCNIPTGRVQPRSHKENSSPKLSLHRCAEKRHMQRVAGILWSCIVTLNQRGIASKAPNGQDRWGNTRICRVSCATVWQCRPYRIHG